MVGIRFNITHTHTHTHTSAWLHPTQHLSLQLLRSLIAVRMKVLVRFRSAKPTSPSTKCMPNSRQEESMQGRRVRRKERPVGQAPISSTEQPRSFPLLSCTYDTSHNTPVRNSRKMHHHQKLSPPSPGPDGVLDEHAVGIRSTKLLGL